MVSTLKVVIDQDAVNRYHDYYFKKYPKRRKPPIRSPIWETVNQWMVLQRMPMNKLKKDWKEFAIWFAHDQGLNDLLLEEIEIKYVFYFKTKHRQDLDNRTPKFLNDGFTEAHVWVDDDVFHLHRLILEYGGVDSDNPRVEIFMTKKSRV